MIDPAQEGANHTEQAELRDRKECRLQGHGANDVGGSQNFQPQKERARDPPPISLVVLET